MKELNDMKKPKGFFTYFHHSELIRHLTDAQAGRLYKALLLYGDEEEETDFSDDQACALAFIILKGEVDLNFERYAEICEKRSEAGRKGGAPKGNTNAQKSIQPNASKTS
jgi:hypothetical protein